MAPLVDEVLAILGDAYIAPNDTKLPSGAQAAVQLENASCSMSGMKSNATEGKARVCSNMLVGGAEAESSNTNEAFIDPITALALKKLEDRVQKLEINNTSQVNCGVALSGPQATTSDSKRQVYLVHYETGTNETCMYGGWVLVTTSAHERLDDDEIINVLKSDQWEDWESIQGQGLEESFKILSILDPTKNDADYDSLEVMNLGDQQHINGAFAAVQTHPLREV